MTRAIHRLVEQRVATDGDAVAIVDGDRSCSYRQLNSAANALARRMIQCGFRRGTRANVRMAPSIELAVLLLAILKAGGCYRWTSSDRPSCEIATGDSTTALLLDRPVLDGVHGGPNLPIITRDTDVACVLDGVAGEGSVVVPHATIAAMVGCATLGRSPWAGEPGAFDMWAALLSGATTFVAAPDVVASAAAPDVVSAFRRTA